MALTRKPRVKAAFGWRTDSSVSAAVRDGTLTKPVKIGERAVAWPAEEIDTLAKARIAGANSDQMRELVNRLHGQRPKLETLMGAL